MRCFTLTHDRTGRDIVLPRLVIKGEPVLRIGAPGSCTELALRGDMVEIFEGLRKHGKDEIWLESVDLSKDRPPLLTPQNDPVNDACLVYVALEHEGQFWYESNTYNEEVYHERRREKVRRVYRDFNEARGIGTVAQGSGPNGETQKLLHMIPGSSFRICRDSIDRSPVLVIAWPGTKLKMITPEKYRKVMAANAATG